MESKQLARFFKRVTSLHCESIQTSKIRRFRPGLDYTVAHYGLLVDKPVLDATVCFVNDDNGDDKQAWESGDVGGFECYIAADDEDEKEGAAKGTEQQHGPADEYNEDDDTQLLSVSPSNNTLNLVYRDPGTLRFVKYVSHSAPSSRYDISMEYTVTDDDDEDEDDGGEDADQEQKTAAENDGDKKPKAA
uniref:Oxoglutarate/iron-dependent oxygenase C-terminal degradation domain-containing protein n=1 Tax=Craspedostauros australis TaxID=1486917 RepID=A0A7R9WT35_9STRA|mmetsp:Transcript_1631/g.4471  ORF Transcript_1631/g.4471 Transcript_1631/m.4471 type:complete len:190 (+) Transcript_1631:1-570(+)